LPIVDQINLDPKDAAFYAEALFGRLVKGINQKLTKGESYEDVLGFIFESLGYLIPYDRMGIALVDELGEKLTLSWVQSKQPVKYLLKKYSARIKESSLKEIFETGKPRIINDLPEYARQNPGSVSTRLALKDGVKSSLTCPLLSNNKPIGIVFFSSFHLNAYDHNHVDVFCNVADELAMVVEQGRLKNFFSDNNEFIQSFRSVLHDLRAPLGIVEGYLDLTMDEEWFKLLDPEAQKIFSHLKRNTQYMFGLLDELIQLNATELVKSPHLVLSFCDEMAQRGEAMANTKDISFQSSFVSLPQIAEFNFEKICRVLDNLFSNAVKFSARKSLIEFSVRGENNRLVFSVKDTGLGIPENEQSLLFCEFGKTSTRPTEGEPSSGLGLAISRKLVEHHHGKIEVTSCPGVGSTFSFWIPL
jgi:signal transduction histidine kinase